MSQTKIKAVELVRQIRDQHYEILKDQSREEIKAFFHREAAAANAESEQLLEQERPSTKAMPSKRVSRTGGEDGGS